MTRFFRKLKQEKVSNMARPYTILLVDYRCVVKIEKKYISPTVHIWCTVILVYCQVTKFEIIIFFRGGLCINSVALLMRVAYVACLNEDYRVSHEYSLHSDEYLKQRLDLSV